MANQSSITTEQLKKQLAQRLELMYAKTPETATAGQVYKALALEIRRMLAEKQRSQMAKTYGEGRKQVYYLSMEFLVGRSLKNNVFNLGIGRQVGEMLGAIGLSFDQLSEDEPDAGLGNGGLGRLAVCYMDALATNDYAATGHSILYEYGIFKQSIVDGWQQELADNWLPGGEIWLQERPDESVEVRFGGEIEEAWNNEYHSVHHVKYDPVLAVPCDMFISGYESKSASLLRLWRAEAASIDMESFNKGDYVTAMQRSGTAEVISKILYPNDNHQEGKLLRLRQQYFLCCAAVNDIAHKHLTQYGTLENLPEKAAIHINDTHPTLAIPELMRIMLDECGYSWQTAFAIARRTFSYTNHTTLSEALERWNAEMLKAELPRIHSIITELNAQMWDEMNARYGDDEAKKTYMSIVDGNEIKMANLCIYVCHSVNGVSKLHSDILKYDLFADFENLAPGKFCNVTNGIAYRRWLLQNNAPLTALLRGTIGDGFMKDADELKKFESFANDGGVLTALAAAKRENKQRLLNWLAPHINEPINPDSIFDVQAKRLHEYKRQHLNALHITAQYLYLKQNPNADFQPQTYLFGAKAAPGYYMAKQIIRYICGLSALLEGDPAVRDKLRVVFIEDYRVTVAEQLMPAAEVSEQISTAGKEASGTGNMKMMLNGAVTIGTLDGANIEIREKAGADNFVLFGMTTEQVQQLSELGYNPAGYVAADDTLKQVLEFMKTGFLGNSYTELYENLVNSDPYYVLADFASYCEAQDRLSGLYRNAETWNRMSLCNIANAGVFSADRAVKQYTDGIWHIDPVI